MKVNKISAVYFSPVSGTKNVCEMIAKAMADRFGISWEAHDFTLPSQRLAVTSFGPDELVVFGTPTYAGRIPNKALPFVQDLFKGQKTPAVAAVTFGNRSFDNSLTELTQELDKNGFAPFAAGAFVCRHVFSDTLAAGRPDADDKEKIQAFAARAADLLMAAEDTAALKAPVIITGRATVGPYYTPKKADGTPAKFLKAKPVTDLTLCDDCGICAKVCPMGSVDPDDISKTPGICIKCHACIRKCPKGARYFDNPDLLSHVKMLEENFSRRREDQTFFAE